MAELKTLGPFYIPVPVTPAPWHHEIVMRATALARSVLAALDRSRSNEKQNDAKQQHKQFRAAIFSKVRQRSEWHCETIGRAIPKRQADLTWRFRD